MPAPVAVAYTLLILLPTIKLVAALISRRSWRRIRVLQAEMEAEAVWTDVDREHIRRCAAAGYGHPALMALPFAMVVAMPIVAVVLAVVGVPEVDRREDNRMQREMKDLRRRHNALGFELDPHFLPVNEILYADPRLHQINDLTFPLAFLRYPVASLLTGVAVILTGWMPMITLGVHLGGKYLANALRGVARTNTLAPLFSSWQVFGV